MMNIGLIGYGKMGKAIEKIAVNRGHSVVAIYDSKNPFSINSMDKMDVAIEFTQPDLAVTHIKDCIDAKIPIVTGTTGWLNQLQAIESYVHQNNGSLLHASNFSIGVNIFFALNRKLAQLMSKQAEYQVGIEEIHHLQKLDAPSGTAISLANGILENNINISEWVLEEGEAPLFNSHQLPITAFRKPDVPGTHIVKYESEIDSITIHHEAHNRQGFALGAVIAAEWLYGKSGVFTMNHVLNIE
jgi:4-hydroxy-tetrahydrodipicolinate reductase